MGLGGKTTALDVKILKAHTHTAGLPVVRTSPDHGTAYEMAGRDQADPRSMKAAIYAAIDIFNRRAEYDDLVANRMTIKAPDTEIKPKGGRIIE